MHTEGLPGMYVVSGDFWLWGAPGCPKWSSCTMAIVLKKLTQASTSAGSPPPGCRPLR
jgi:hypothetical protein